MKLHGIRVPHKKNTAECAPVRMAVPASVTIPMSMHIGKPAKAVVKRGDKVKVGQLIGEADGFVSSNIYSSVSGTVQKVDEMTASNGAKIACVVIAADGQQEIFEEIVPPKVKDFDSFISAVRASGAVGLGGAGFPTFIKLGVKDLSKIDAVVINAAECEPYITSDTRTMLDKGEYVFKGIEALKKYMGVKRFIIGIENNKKAAVQKMQALAAQTDGVEIHVLPSVYPQGGEKVLVYNTVRKIIPKGGLPLDVGVIVINVTTLAFIAEYLETGIPLVEKCVTVDGSAVKEPKNVIVPIGTPIEALIEGAGGLKCDPAKVLYGGPMMGIAVPSLAEPVLKNTNAVIVMDEKEAKPPKTTPCISCGACLNHCPLRLDPRAIARAYKLQSGEDLEKLCVDLCMECGCCSYICPANRPLVQTNKLAKIKLREYAASKKAEQEKEEK
ncbi:MAG: electron transport complex subunit RsxC [Clostridia bacterium]|nr:electron transport complex subunit RsxC [Clostridia bacterium]MBR2176852.1 electron transport complex subunit RsxC [Clostridia bacterium]